MVGLLAACYIGIGICLGFVGTCECAYPEDVIPCLRGVNLVVGDVGNLELEQVEIMIGGGPFGKLGCKVNPEIDEIEYKGRKVENQAEDLVYILLNKPIGVVTTSKD